METKKVPTFPQDPLGLLPYESKRFVPEDPKVKKLPRAYRGSINNDFLNNSPPIERHPHG